MSRIEPTYQEQVEQRARWSGPKKGHRHSVVSTAGPNADNWAAILDSIAWHVDNGRARAEEEDELDI